VTSDPIFDRYVEPVAEWDDRSINPLNKPLDPSVTERYYTSGGKEIAAVHDQERSLWHVEFKEGGRLPPNLNGKFTDEKTARHAIKIYLAMVAQD
jgi:hypothetical protein